MMILGELTSMLFRVKTGRSNMPAIAALSVLAASAVFSMAQAAPSGSAAPKPSLLDFAAGYSYLHPFDSSIKGVAYQPVYPGVVASIAGYFNRSIGIQVEGGIFKDGPNDSFATIAIGP